MALIAQLLARLGLDSSGFDAGAKKATRSLHDLQKEATEAQTRMARWVSAAGGIAAVTYGARIAWGALKSISQAAIEGEQSQLRLTTAMRAFSGATDEQIARLSRAADAMSRHVSYTDDEIRQQMALAASMGISADSIESVTKASIGLSQQYGQSLLTTMTTLRSVLNGDISGLRTFGITVKSTSSIADVMNNVIATGLKSYDAATDSYTNMTSALSNTAKAWQDVKEAAGEALGPPMTEGLKGAADGFRLLKEQIEGVGSAFRAMHEWGQKGLGEFRASLRAKYKPDADEARMIGPAGAGDIRDISAMFEETARANEAARVVADAAAEQRKAVEQQIKNIIADRRTQIEAEIDALQNTDGIVRRIALTEKQRREIEAAGLDVLKIEQQIRDALARDNRRLEQAQRLKAAEESLANTFTSNVDDMLFEGKRWQDGMISMVKAVTREIANILIVEQAAKAFAKGAGWIIGAIAGTAQHIGGFSGTRDVPALAYATAPRLHNGYFGPGEFPAILDKRETVNPPGGPQLQVNINNQSGTQLKASASPLRLDGRRWVTSIVLEDLAQNGQMRQAMEKLR